MQIRCTKVNHRNQQIIGFCIDGACKNQRPYCNFCLPCHSEHLDRLTSLELLSEWIQQGILKVHKVQKNFQECKLTLDSLISLFLPYLNFNIQQLPELGLSQIDSLIKGLCQMDDLEENLFKQLNQSIQQIISIVNKIHNIIKNQININQNEKLQNPYCNIDKLALEQTKHVSKLQPNLNPFTFDLMKQNSIKYNELCFAIAINKDCSIVVAGYNKDIKVFQHLSGKLNQIQLLGEHTSSVYLLNFMKNTNNFISGSYDNSIIIWQVIGHNQWNFQQKLNGHSYQIFCFLMNNSDDLIISGSVDKTIKFWMKQDQWLCQQTISDHTSSVCSLSLNEQQNKLISCSYDQQILVMEQQKLNKLWSVTQKIKLDYHGERLCFINDNQFTFQPYCKEQMHVYEMDSNIKQYQETKDIAVKCGSSIDNCFFPQQYLKSKCLLLNKNGKNINLLRKKENGEFIIEQSIEFGTYAIYGQLSDDGEYLITWDEESKEIQIRKCKEL